MTWLNRFQTSLRIRDGDEEPIRGRGRPYGRRTEIRTQVRKVSRKLCLIRLFSGWQEFRITTGLTKH